MKHLYLIGNGFDKHHDIPSGYRDFHEWLKNSGREELVEQIDELYDYSEDLWSYFEKELGNLEVEAKAQAIYREHPADKLSDHYERTFHEAAIIAGDDIGAVYNKIRKSFPDWVRSLPKGNSGKCVKVEDDAFFITFNYTDTLHDLYGIPFNHILYIHHRAAKDKFLVLGHGKSAEQVKKESENDCDEYTETAYMQTVETIERQVNMMRKDSAGIIEQNQWLWNSLSDVEQIYVYGCCMEEVDKPYFQQIVNSTNSLYVKWQVDVFGEDKQECEKEFSRKKNYLLNIGVDESLVSYCRLADIQLLKQPPLF